MAMLSPAEVAEKLNISYDTALRLIKSGGIPHLKIGRQYRVNEGVINDLISQTDIITITYDEQ